MPIRTYDDSDEAAVVELWEVVFPGSKPWNEPSFAIAQKRRVQRDLFLVGVVDDRVVGTVMAGYDGHRGWLYLVAVAPGHRRQGFGAALVAEAEARLRRKGCVKINLQVRASNDAVVAFYERLGFSIEDHVSMGKAFPVPGVLE